MLERVRKQLSRGAAPRIWVIGDVMLDRYFLGSVERVSPEAPVPVLLLERSEDKSGGAANVAQNILALGGQAALGGRLGSDEPASCLRQLLRSAGVPTSGLVSEPGAVTTVKQRALAGAQQLLRIDHERSHPLQPATIESLLDGLAADLPQPDLVLLSDYAKGVVSRELLARLRQRLPAVPIFVDPKGRDYTKYVGANLLTPNEAEAALASGVAVRDEPSLLAAAERLAAQVPGAAILVTRSARGMSLLLPTALAERRLDGDQAAERPGGDAARLLSAPAQARRVFDVTGAGDTALAALAVGWGSGLLWPEILHLANVAAGIKVGKVGAVPVYLSEVLAALAHEQPSVKLIERGQLSGLRQSATANGQRLVFTNGCFDILHVGHLRLLEQSRRLGDLLVVAINSDESVRRLKGQARPVNPVDDRASLLSGLECVDFVTVFAEDTPLETILGCRPDVLVKGGDYSEQTIVGAAEVKSWGGRVEVIPLIAGRSSTRLIERLAERSAEPPSAARSGRLAG
jgi:D-beta-D-heptose 7-phosphate kinase/D-beta-D-heptose 1-phosphate adenosyltransferase